MFFRWIPVNRLRLLLRSSSTASSYQPLSSSLEAISSPFFSRHLHDLLRPIGTTSLLDVNHEKALNFRNYGFFPYPLGGVAKGSVDLYFSSSIESSKHPVNNVEGGSTAGNGGDAVICGDGPGAGGSSSDIPFKGSQNFSLYQLFAIFITIILAFLAFCQSHLNSVRESAAKKEKEEYEKEKEVFFMELNKRLDHIIKTLEKIIEQIQVEKK